MTEQSQQAEIKRTVKKLSLIVLGMCGFAFALVPLYDLFCEVTGLNGKTGGPYVFDEASAEPDRSRLIKVSFLTNTNEGMPWEFWSGQGAVRVHPGEAKTVSFFSTKTLCGYQSTIPLQQLEQATSKPKNPADNFLLN